jgi:hypothetical protein
MLLKALLRICVRKQIPSNFIPQELVQEKLKCIFLLLDTQERKKKRSSLGLTVFRYILKIRKETVPKEDKYCQNNDT